MRLILSALSVLSLALSAVAAQAAQMEILEFPWKNGPAAGSVYKMSDHPNGVFVFEAFSINCTFCNQNVPQVKAFVSKYSANARVQVIDLGLDTADSAYTRWISQHRPTYPVVMDTGRRAWTALRQENGIPQTFVVNCRGELVDHTIGLWNAASVVKLDAAVAKALETTCVAESTPTPAPAEIRLLPGGLVTEPVNP